MYNRTMEDLIEAIKNARKNDVRINFLIGAGFSASAGIPLANGLTKMVEKNYTNEYKYLEEENYSSCMSVITATERKKLINESVNKAKVNWAHLMLAQLLNLNYVNSVLTTNFDNLLLRACSMVNCFPGIYDLAATKGEFREELLLSNSIIHLHGQHTGFLLCNTQKELSEQIGAVERVFAQLNKNCMWIVVGYSGGSDSIVELFKRYKNSDNRLFWIGYNDEEVNEELKELFQNRDKYCFHIKGYDADSFMVDLVKKLNLDPPEIIKKPFSYLESMINEISDYEAEARLPFLPTKSRVETMSSLVKKAIDKYEKDNKLMAEYYRDLDLIEKIEEYLVIADKEVKEIEEIKQGNIKVDELIKELIEFAKSIDENEDIDIDRYRDIGTASIFIRLLPKDESLKINELLIEKLKKCKKNNFEVESLLIKTYIRIFEKEKDLSYLKSAKDILKNVNKMYYSENRHNIIDNHIKILEFIGNFEIDRREKELAIEAYDEILKILDKYNSEIENYRSIKIKILIKKIFVDIEKNFMLLPELNENIGRYMEFLSKTEELDRNNNIFIDLVELELKLNENSKYKIFNNSLEYTTLQYAKSNDNVIIQFIIMFSYYDAAKGIKSKKYNHSEKEFIKKQLLYIIEEFKFNDVDKKLKSDIATGLNEIAYLLIKGNEIELAKKYIQKSLNVKEEYYNCCTYGLLLLYKDGDVEKFKEMYSKGIDIAETKSEIDAVEQTKYLELGEYEGMINSNIEEAINYIDNGIEVGRVEGWEHLLFKLSGLKEKMVKKLNIEENESIGDKVAKVIQGEKEIQEIADSIEEKQ